MSTNDYPNQNALRDANNVYLDVMRGFIKHHLRKVKGKTVEDLIEEALLNNQMYEFNKMLEKHKDVELAIDFNFIPRIINIHWRNIFEQNFNEKLIDQNRLWLIKEGRNKCEHRGSDLDPELTRTHLNIIAELLKNINRSDKQEEVESIRDQLISDNMENQISEISEKLQAAEKDNSKNKKDLADANRQIENLEKQQSEAKEKIEKLKNVEDEKKQSENELKKVKKEKKSSEERVSEIEQQCKEIENQNIDYEKRIEELEGELSELKLIKETTEDSIASTNNLLNTVALVDNQMFPPINTESTVRIFDQRKTDKKNYILNLLELKKPTLIYVQDEQKINQFYNLVKPEYKKMIGKHSNSTTKAEEKKLIVKLDKGELIAIVSNEILSTLTTEHCIEHFVFCHLVPGLEMLYAQCNPAFTSCHNTFLHLLYDSEQDLKLLYNLYPDRKPLEKIYMGLRSTIDKMNGRIVKANIYEKMDVEKLKFEAGCAIFEELGLLERNEKGIKILSPIGKKLEESKIYRKGEKLKQGIKEFFDFQNKLNAEQIWDKLVENIDIAKERIIPI